MTYTLATIVNGIPTPLEGIPRNLNFREASEVARHNNEQWESLIKSGKIKPLVAFNMGAL
jgi:hypothetical protein